FAFQRTLAGTLFNLGRFQEAFTAADAGVTAARFFKHAEPLVSSLMWRARASYALGSKDKAIRDAREAIAVIESLRAALVPSDLMKRGFSDNYLDLAQDAVAWLHEAGRYNESLEIAEQTRARAFLDLLATRRVERSLEIDEEEEE